MAKVEILGVKIDDVNLSEALVKVAEFLDSNRQNWIATCNPEIVLTANSDQKYRDILNSASLAIADGFGIILAAIVLRGKFVTKITGTDFMADICHLCAQKKKSIFLLGGEKGVAEKTAENLQKMFPNLKVAGFLDGDFDLSSCADFINQSPPDVLLVALGAPKQEIWIYENLSLIKSVKIAMGVGGAFDFWSGNKKRAPKFMMMIGFEWLWRLMMEPRRLKRIFNAVIVFPAVVVYARVFINSK